MQWREALRGIGRTAHLMVGVPDYDAYVAHRSRDHPGEPVMSLKEFHRERTARRFDGGAEGISRCC